jgi:putative transcriptional regulator
LCEAIERAENGLIDADLGGCIIKQRVGRKGQGRSSGYRVLIAVRLNKRYVLMEGFAKNEKSNISEDELVVLRQYGSAWLNADEEILDSAIKMGKLIEVIYEKKPSRLTKNLVEMGKGLKDLGLLDEETYEKITMRLLKKEKKVIEIEPLTSDEIRSIREREHLSQAVLANYLNLTVGYISQLERGFKKPTGAVLALLNVIRHKGINAIRY